VPHALLFIDADVVAILTTTSITSITNTAIIIIIIITTSTVVAARAAAIAQAAAPAALTMMARMRAVGLGWLSIPGLHLHIPTRVLDRGLHPRRIRQ